MLDHRKFDFTCCDIEAEIIARNTVILTLIADDKGGALSQHLWNIYYHVFLNKGSMKVLQTHVKNVLKYSSETTVGPNSAVRCSAYSLSGDLDVKWDATVSLPPFSV